MRRLICFEPTTAIFRKEAGEIRGFWRAQECAPGRVVAFKLNEAHADHFVDDAGNFTTRYGTTDEFLALASEESGQDLTWFFRGYLYQAALPDLRQTREDGQLSLEWVTGDGGAFPMPVEVEINGRRQTVAMSGGRGRIAVPAGAHVLIDPDNKVLRRDAFIEEWRAAGGR